MNPGNDDGKTHSRSGRGRGRIRPESRARVSASCRDAELIGIVDTNAERAKAVAAEFDTAVLPGIESLAGKVDAVSVAVPTAQHAKIGCALLRQGIDVLVEKPMAASLSEADD